MGLLGVWNASFLGYRTRTILPYAEALLKLPAHIQQLAMESNGELTLLACKFKLKLSGNVFLHVCIKQRSITALRRGAAPAAGAHTAARHGVQR
jgi:Phosphoglucose isomerase